jgi:hypothetical protein
MTEVYSELGSLGDGLRARGEGVFTIKSRIFFEILERRNSLHNSACHIPLPPTQIGSITVFEAAIFSSLLMLMGASKIVEIGTYIGYSTAIFALNSSPGAQIISFDLPLGKVQSLDGFMINSQDLLNDWKLNDNFLRHQQSISGEVYIKDLPEESKSKILLIKADSTHLTADQKRVCKDADLFFIDGGHDYSTIKSDSQLARESIQEDGIIVWHDYNSRIHKEVTEYIDDEFSSTRAVFHVENTLLAFTLNNPLKSLFRA